MDTIKDSKRLTRRRHDAALKAKVLANRPKTEASGAGIALAHGLNADLVHKWRRMMQKIRPHVISCPSTLSGALTTSLFS